MLIEVKVPQLAEGTPEGTLAAWHVKAGEAVKRDQNLCDIETDKVVLETPAQGDGCLVYTSTIIPILDHMLQKAGGAVVQ